MSVECHMRYYAKKKLQDKNSHISIEFILTHLTYIICNNEVRKELRF